MEIVSLCAPWVLLVLVLILLVMLVLRKWKISAGLFVVFLIINWQFRCFSFVPLIADSGEGVVLKVLSFNVNLALPDEEYNSRQEGIAEIIRTENADVVFVTENFGTENDSLYCLLQQLYPFRTQKVNMSANNIYSKYPILTDSIIEREGEPFAISICRLQSKEGVIDVYGCHLCSNNYNEHLEYMTPDSIANKEQAHTYLGNINAASSRRLYEAKMICCSMDKHIPTIVMGDMNDVSGSPAMRALESAGFTDAWWKGGFGYGATIHHPLPYRIDHIMFNDGLKLKSVKKINAEGLSDHDALVAEFYFE